MGDWINSEQSSTVKRFAYDGEKHVLTVEFKPGATYRYANVPQDVFDQMQGAESVGRLLAQSVKGKFKHTRI